MNENAAMSRDKAEFIMGAVILILVTMLLQQVSWMRTQIAMMNGEFKEATQRVDELNNKLNASYLRDVAKNLDHIKEAADKAKAPLEDANNEIARLVGQSTVSTSQASSNVSIVELTRVLEGLRAILLDLHNKDAKGASKGRLDEFTKKLAEIYAKDARGNATGSLHDLDERVKMTTDAITSKLGEIYTKDARGNESGSLHDLNGQVKVTTDAITSKLSEIYTKDARGNATGSLYDLGERVKFTTDVITNKLGEIYTKDARGNESGSLHDLSGQVKITTEVITNKLSSIYKPASGAESESGQLKGLSTKLDELWKSPQDGGEGSGRLRDLDTKIKLLLDANAGSVSRLISRIDDINKNLGQSTTGLTEAEKSTLTSNLTCFLKRQPSICAQP